MNIDQMKETEFSSLPFVVDYGKIRIDMRKDGGFAMKLKPEYFFSFTFLLNQIMTYRL